MCNYVLTFCDFMKEEKKYQNRDGSYVATAAAYYAIKGIELFAAMVFTIPDYLKNRRENKNDKTNNRYR